MVKYTNLLWISMSYYGFSSQQLGMQLPTPIIPSGAQTSANLLPYVSLTIDLPIQEYKPMKIAMIPFDPRSAKDTKFVCLADALKFIYKHCMANHGFCTKQLAKKYLQFVRILNMPTGMFIVMTNFGKKEYDQAFNKVRQQIESKTG